MSGVASSHCALESQSECTHSLLGTLCASGACHLAVSLFLHVWAQGAVGGECVCLSELSFCFMGQAVSWPRWLRGQVFFCLFFFLVSCVVFFFFFFNYFVLWYFSSLGIIFNSKTGLTAVAFLFHLFL